MKFILFALLIGLASAEDVINNLPLDDDKVIKLSRTNFDDALKLENLLVEFYAPWCGHCKAFAPVYAALNKQLRDLNSNIYIAKVDATEEIELSERYAIKGYPTLKFFKKGEPNEYNGVREKDDLFNWLLKKTGPPTVNLTTVDDTKSFKKENSISIIGFFSNLDSDQAKAYLEVAKELDDYIFGITNSKEVFDLYEVKQDSIVLFKDFDEKRNDLVENINQNVIKKFISVNSLPLLIEFNQNTASKIFGGEIKSHILLFYSNSSSNKDQIIEAFGKVAPDYKSKVLFVTINVDLPDHARILEFFSLKKSDIPSLRLINLEEDMKKYKPAVTKEFSVDFVKNFIKGVFDGSIKQYLLSQDLPEDWDKNNVKVLVSSNFDEVALDPSKDVLVEFYAPWCGHCKKLEPIYDELGVKFASNDKIVIAKIDATANELETIKISSFPTIKLFKRDTNEVFEYNGERTLEGLTKFIETGGEYGRAATTDKEEDEEEEKPEDVAVKRDEL